MDVASVLQPPSRRLYIMLLATYGMMSNLDVGTESLRWMGDTRFTLGALWVRHSAQQCCSAQVTDLKYHATLLSAGCSGHTPTASRMLWLMSKPRVLRRCMYPAASLTSVAASSSVALHGMGPWVVCCC